MKGGIGTAMGPDLVNGKGGDAFVGMIVAISVGSFDGRI